MARKSTPKKKSPKRDPERVLRHKRIAIASALTVGAGAVFVGAAMGIAQLDRQAAAFIVPQEPEVVIDWPADATGRIWMPVGEREQIEKLLAHAVAGGRALSRAPLEEAGRALMATGWVDRAPTVRWTSKGEIEIGPAWRVPAAAVRAGNREFIIDWDRRVLPLDYAIDESNQRYFTNADARLPKVGEQWPGTDLQDGLALLGLLRDKDLLEQVAGFDLGTGAESGTLSILTTRGARVIWGAGPGRERPAEQPSGVKADRLKALFDRSGLIDGGAPLVDIRGPDILFQRREG